MCMPFSNFLKRCKDKKRNKSSAVAEMGDRGHNRHGPKRGGCCAPFAGAGTPSSTMWPGPRPTCKPGFILIRPTVWRQYTNVTDRHTDRQYNGPIAQGEPFYKRSPKNNFGERAEFRGSFSLPRAWWRLQAAPGDHSRQKLRLAATTASWIFQHELLLKLLWLPRVSDADIIFLPCCFFFLSIFFFPGLISAVADWMSAIFPHMVWP